MAMLNNQMVMFLANPNDIMIALDHSGMIYSRLYHMMLGGEKMKNPIVTEALGNSSSSHLSICSDHDIQDSWQRRSAACRSQQPRQSPRQTWQKLVETMGRGWYRMLQDGEAGKVFS